MFKFPLPAVLLERTKGFVAEHDNFVLRSAVTQLIERLWKDSSPAESLCCVLEQDTLSATQFWFNPGNWTGNRPE